MNTLLKRIKKRVKSKVKKLTSNLLPSIQTSEKQVALDISKLGYFGCTDELMRPCVSGWISYTDESINPVSLKITKGAEVRFVQADDIRNDVLKTGRVKTAMCGYSVSFSADNFECAVVEVLSPTGKLSKVTTNYKNRKIFFIHIPKAAGSSVNDLISSVIDGSYYTHIEGLRSSWNEIKDARFLSGHIRYNDYENNFSQHDYVVFAFLREPFSHLKSHMNWVRRLAEPELVNSRDSHSVIVHKIADDLATLDFSDVNNIECYVKRIKPIAYGLFDNCQVRYLSDVKPNERVSQKHLDQAINNMRHLHFVGISEYSKESQTQLLSFLGLEAKAAETKSNVNSYDYGLNVNKKLIIDALNPLVKYDLQLYAEAKNIFSLQSQRINASK